jgi:hypothetical protein
VSSKSREQGDNDVEPWRSTTVVVSTSLQGEDGRREIGRQLQAVGRLLAKEGVSQGKIYRSDPFDPRKGERGSAVFEVSEQSGPLTIARSGDEGTLFAIILDSWRSDRATPLPDEAFT